MDIDLPLPLLGGLSPAQFMRRHWQKKPFVIRQAVPGVQPPLPRAELFDLAGRDDVESRLLVQGRTGSCATARSRAARDRKSTRLNSSHSQQSRMPSSA